MRYWIAAFAILLTLIRVDAFAESETFAEQFALAHTAQRERLIENLVAGTGDYFYYRCLHYQNTRNTAALDETLTAWTQARVGKQPRRDEIELREAIFRYGDDTEASLKRLRDHFEFDPQKILPPPGAAIDRPDLTSQLEPDDINTDAFIKAIHDHASPLSIINAQTANWMIATKQKLPPNIQLRDLLKKCSRSDIPNLLSAVRKELDLEKKRTGFGYLPIHKSLTLPQLDALLKTHPKLRESQNFIEIYLSKLRPSSMEPGSEIEKRTAYFKRATDFTATLPPAMVATHSHLLRHWLQLDLQRGKVNRDRLLSYIKIPRRTDYMDRAYLRTHERPFYPGKVDLRECTGLTRLPSNDEGLVRESLLTLFRTKQNTEAFATYLNADWLRKMAAEAQVLSGEGDREKHFSTLGAKTYQALLERIEINIPNSNPTRHAPADDVTLKVDVKNVPKLTIKVFEINALNYFLTNKKDLDLSIDLDGLVPTSQTNHDYDSPPAQRVTREFSFPQLKGKRGAWIIEFVGNGTSSRALIRKGELHAIPRSTVAGHAFRVFDADRKPVKSATLWLGGREFLTDSKTGDILVPYSTKPGRTPFIITDGKLALLDHFEHEAETYKLTAGIFVDRESLIAGNTAKLIARPSLTINGVSADLALLEETTLTITSIDQNETRSTQRISDFKLNPNQELVHEFQVPDRLSSLAFEISAKVENLSTLIRQDLSTRKDIEVNTIDSGQLIASPHLTKSGNDYQLEILGKNGEALPGKAVRIRFRHPRFMESQEIDFTTDADGKISLGSLDEITVVEAEVDQLTQSWQLQTKRQLGPWPSRRTFHLAVGDTLSIPSNTPHSNLNWENYALVEFRGSTPVRNWFKALSERKDGVVSITGLPPGSYRLITYDGNPHTILVSADKPSSIIGSEDLWLARTPEKKHLALAIEAPAEGDKTLKLRVTNPDNQTRVHVTASHYAPHFHFFGTMLGAPAPPARSHWINRAENRFASGRAIGDEYRYILERRDLPKFPGNQLPRPGVILNPWDIGASTSDLNRGKSGSMFFGSEGKPKKKSNAPLRDNLSRYTSAESQTNLDFLPLQTRAFYNLKPDKDGVIEIDLKQLGSARFIRALAIADQRSASASLALPAIRPDKRDRRLQKVEQLDPRGRFTRTRASQVMQAGEKLMLDRPNSARFQIYSNLRDAFYLLRATSNAATLDEFAFILDWPDLKDETKHRLYSQYTCHELNVFLSEHDPSFFKTSIQPYLRNKLEKDFIDHYLLGNDLSGYLETWRFIRLNAAERALLARRLTGEEKNQTIQGLLDLQRSKPVDYAAQERLFDTALAGKDLSTEQLRTLAMIEASTQWDGGENQGVEYIRIALKQTIIPEIDFNDVTIDEAVTFLRRQSKLHDSRGEGINIVIRDPNQSDPFGGEDKNKINLQLNNVPLGEALKFTTELAGLKYKVDSNVVVITPGYDDAGQFVTQTFRVPPDFLSSMSDTSGAAVDDPFGGGGDASSGLKRRPTAREILEMVGVPFPEGASASYIAATGELVVRNSSSNSDLIGVFVESINEGTGISGNGSVAGDDPFAGGEDLFPSDAVDDPFGGGGGGGGAALGIQLRTKGRQFYRKLGDTEELAETHYYKLDIIDQTADHIPANAFWSDFSNWDGKGAFLSSNFTAASANFSDAMLALAVLDLPFTNELPELKKQNNRLTVTPKGATIAFSEQIQSAALEAGDVVIGQKFYPLAQPTRLELGERVPNYIDNNFVISTAYGSHVVATNPTGRHLHFDLLRQLPHGAIPINQSPVTDSSRVDLEPYSTRTFTMEFYFPIAGKFVQYPAQASADGKAIASTASKTFSVAMELGEVDATSWRDLAARGSNDAVLTFLLNENLHYHALDRISWRMKDEFFFLTAIEILRQRQIYHHGLYSFSLMHSDPRSTAQFLLNSGRFLREIGETIESDLLTVAPRERRLYEHLEYKPLINARRHQLGNEPRIVNEQFAAQYKRLMKLLSHKTKPDDEDRLSLVYYLLLQDRVAEALDTFEKIDAQKLATRLQYDYFQCYLDFYRAEAGKARRVALKHKDHPVDRWRQLFEQVISQADETTKAADVAIADPRDREQQQDQLAASSKSLDFEVEAGQLRITHRNLKSAQINYYKMDLEFLFSANPFVDSDTDRFRFVKPNRSQPLKFANPDKPTELPLPKEFRNENVLVEIVAGGQSKAKAIFANDLDVTISSNYGRLQVKHAKSGKPMSKTYVKVYARMLDGEVKFYKDGYTDLRGKFEYASISAEEPGVDNVDRFAILLMSEDSGALVQETAPPNHRQ